MYIVTLGVGVCIVYVQLDATSGLYLNKWQEDADCNVLGMVPDNN